MNKQQKKRRLFHVKQVFLKVSRLKLFISMIFINDCIANISIIGLSIIVWLNGPVFFFFLHFNRGVNSLIVCYPRSTAGQIIFIY